MALHQQGHAPFSTKQRHVISFILMPPASYFSCGKADDLNAFLFASNVLPPIFVLANISRDGGDADAGKTVSPFWWGCDVTSLLDDICAAGYNVVNADYGLVPDCRFPVPVIQANQALAWCEAHAGEYGLDMDDAVIMGSSAGAIIASQMGAVISNPEYAAELGIEPSLEREQVRAVVIDDAPLVYDEFSLGTKILIGNYVRGTIFLSKEEKHRYDATQWVTSAYPPAVLLGSEYCNDMRAMDAAVSEGGAAHELIDPLAERGLKMPHCFVASERSDEVARDALERMLAFLADRTDVG